MQLFSEITEELGRWKSTPWFPSFSAERGVALTTEVLYDACLTAFLLTGAMMPQRINDVRQGKLPRVSPDAFPRGRVLQCLFPAYRRRKARAAAAVDDTLADNLATWLGVALSMGLSWTGLTLAVLSALWSPPSPVLVVAAGHRPVPEGCAAGSLSSTTPPPH